MPSYNQNSLPGFSRSQRSKSSGSRPLAEVRPVRRRIPTPIHPFTFFHLEMLDGLSHGRCMNFAFTKISMIYPHSLYRSRIGSASEETRSRSGRSFSPLSVSRCQNCIKSQSICKGKSKNTRRTKIDLTQIPQRIFRFLPFAIIVITSELWACNLTEKYVIVAPISLRLIMVNRLDLHAESSSTRLFVNLSISVCQYCALYLSSYKS